MVILLQQFFYLLFFVEDFPSQFDKRDTPRIAIVLQGASIDMQPSGKFLVRQIPLPPERWSVSFPQGIYPFYHTVGGIEEVHDFLVILGLYIITHSPALDLMVIKILLYGETDLSISFCTSSGL